MVNPIFQLDQVSYQFGALVALKEIAFTIYPGERIALVGASGAGKSTLINLLNGTLVPTTGKISALGYSLHRLSGQRRRQVQRRIGTIYQQHHLVTNLRVIHNVNVGHLGRWPLYKAVGSLLWPLDVSTASRALTQVGMPEKLYARTDQLSGGQQQRVAIARVLVQNPDVILADEPIASVDPERSREIMDLLRDLCCETGKTLVTSLHNLDVARQYCDRMIALRAGQLLFDAPTQQVSSRMIDALYQH